LSGSGLFSLIGDPTLRFPRVVNSNAQIEINISQINFGDIAKCDYSNTAGCEKKQVSFEIRNVGTEDLQISPFVLNFNKYNLSPYYENIFFSQWSQNLVSGYGPVIKSGEKMVVSVYFMPPNAGSYGGSYFIISNSKANPVIELPFVAHGI
jgi:hypothetical protein